jgi:hypothetical protein
MSEGVSLLHLIINLVQESGKYKSHNAFEDEVDFNQRFSFFVDKLLFLNGEGPDHSADPS